MKNITIVDNVIGNTPPHVAGALYPIGRFMFIGNVDDEPMSFDFKISESTDNTSIASITEEAELKLLVDQIGWDLLMPYVQVTEGIEIYNEEEMSFIITTTELSMEDVEFPANTRLPIYLGFNFLTDEVSNEVFYTFKLEQFESSTNKLLGGEHFEVTRALRNPFYADAGINKNVRIGESVNLNATIINEPAIYNWYNNGDLIHSGTSINVSPEEFSTYILEVISEADGYKDYDEVDVLVQYNWLETISPNPASTQISIDYNFQQGTAASIMLLNSTATYQQSYPISLGSSNKQININSYTSGSYSVILLVDGIAVDSQTLIIQ